MQTNTKCFNMNKKLNLLKYSDDKRNIFIQYEDENFYLMNQNAETLEETATCYSFEAFVRTFNAMNYFFEQLALNDKEVAKKLFKMRSINSKTNISYV